MIPFPKVKAHDTEEHIVQSLKHSALWLALASWFLAVPTSADTVADFYEGKTVRIVIATGPGGGYFLYSMLLCDGLKAYLPGHPDCIVEPRPGSGGLHAANYLYDMRRVPRDGTYIGAPLRNIGTNFLLKKEGVRYVPYEFIAIGGADINAPLLIVRADTDVRTLEDAKIKKIPFGASAKSSPTSIVPRVVNGIFNTRFAVTHGYKGGMHEIFLAIERGEVLGASTTLDILAGLHPEWMRNGFVIMLASASSSRDMSLPDVPTLLELFEGTSAIDREVLSLLAQEAALGRAWIAPPDVPEDRVLALRTAFKKTVRGALFRSRLKENNLSVREVSHEDVQAALAATASANEQAVNHLRDILSLEE